MRNSKIRLRLALACLLTLLPGCEPTSQAQVAITLDPSTTYQTISGWEGAAQIGQLECPSFNLYKDQLLDRIAFELGINRIRLEIGSGIENPTDYFTQFASGQLSLRDWIRQRYTVINDNSNPNSANPAGFQFTSLDHQIRSVALPLRQRLATLGEQLFINLTYVHFNPITPVHVSNPAEYAELVLAVYQHMQSTFGFVPDTWEVILEPDNVNAWDGTVIGQAIAAAAGRLQAAGFTPRFVTPSTAGMGGILQGYFDAMVTVPGVAQYVQELAYHRYRGAEPSDVMANLQWIVQRAQQHRMQTAMLEHIGSGYEDLHQDLSVGQVSAWQQYSLGFCDRGNPNTGSRHFNVDTTDVQNPVVHMQSRSKFLRQYFRWVRRGAVRIGATSQQGQFEPLGFINADGKYVVVVKANGEGTFTVGGLPAGTYGVRYTTSGWYDVDGGDETVTTGSVVEKRIPAAGVITIFATGDQGTNTGVLEHDKPPGFFLHSNYPNPFSQTTTIIFDLPAPAHAVLTLFDVLGRQIATPVNNILAAGRHYVHLNAQDYAGGLYFYQLDAGSYSHTKTLTLIK